ncbi:hypothetical protein [Chryseobacterium sp. MMS23-Vi53]|uniref:hypothetical protein n=1 Tax=Chryseobacterium sp. MMS23-Vi53 TaxID=3386644 RepID=UPI0039ED5AD1
MKSKFLIFLILNIGIHIFNAQQGSVGIDLSNPGTKLDINGGITNREIQIPALSNSVTIPGNTSFVQITGLATGDIDVSAPTAPNPGQRLIIYNNTSGGFDAFLNGVIIPNGTALEFVYSNTDWRGTDGGSPNIADEANNKNYYGWLKPTNIQPTLPTDNTANIYHASTGAIGNIGIGPTAPTARIDLVGTATAAPLKISNLRGSETLLPAANGLAALALDANGYFVKQYSGGIQIANSYMSEGIYTAAPGVTSTIFNNIGTSTIVIFKFTTDLSLGQTDGGILYAQVSFSAKDGFKVGNDWSYSDNSSSTVTLSGLGTSTLTFDSNTSADLVFNFDGSNITVTKTIDGTSTDYTVYVYEGKKIR